MAPTLLAHLLMSMPRPPPTVHARDVFLGAALPLTNCVLIVALLAWGRYSFPARDMASLGIVFSMMILWTPARLSHQTTLAGRIACWSLFLVSGVFLAMMLMMGMSAP